MAKPEAPRVRRRSVGDYANDPQNVNKGSERGRAMLEMSVRELGVGRSLVADKNGVIVAGNKTHEVLASLGIDDVIEVETDGRQAVVVKRTDLDLSTERGRKLALADNRTQTVGYVEDLAALGAIAEVMPGATKGLWGEEELRALLKQATPMGAVDAEPQIDRAAELRAEWKTERGQIWQLGEHRLMCGDSTKAEDVARLMGGERAGLMNTDPPYGINYGDIANSRDGAAAKKQGKDATDYSTRDTKHIENDDLDGAALQEFLEACIRTAVPHLIDNPAFYLWHPMLTQGTFFAAAAADILIHRQIIWVKPSLILGRGDYHWRHELCFYGWIRGKHCAWLSGRDQTTIWEAGREGDGIHPTQKPLELFIRPIQNHLQPGEICYEPFTGSGSQIIAAEQLGRRCYAMEIEPKYVAVTLQRYQDATGKTPTLLESA